ncbi:MAG: helix-turn-helix transcriptional regulator [Gammaproteobacteria bacterium]|nr:helix-turn-helix transcriptional regulator [Gammaproteobacteria bacterium]
MSLYTPDETNVLFTSEHEITEICQPMFGLLDLEYYSYGRFYDDGKCVLLSTNKNVFENHFKKEYKLTIPPNEDSLTQQKIYNLIMIDDELPEIIADEHNLFNHGVMMDLIKKHSHYYEMFCFVAKKNAIDPVNKFLNSLDKLDHFSEHFLNCAKGAIQTGHQNIIELPPSMKPLINGSSNVESIGHSIYYRGISIPLSKRQIECLSFLTMGKTTKEIANILQISIKTVEDHIKALKLKLNCNLRSALCYAGIQNNLTTLALELLRRYEVI